MIKIFAEKVLSEFIRYSLEIQKKAKALFYMNFVGILGSILYIIVTLLVKDFGSMITLFISEVNKVDNIGKQTNELIFTLDNDIKKYF